LRSDGTIVAANESFARMHGYQPEDLQSLNLRDLDTPDTLRGLPGRLKRILAGETLTFEVEHYHKDGHVVPLEVTSSQIVSNGESLIQAFHRDISERKQAADRINNLAYYDPLTHLPNRRLLMDRLAQACTAALAAVCVKATP
jgi:PAS domain S-box-containing protein